MFVLMKIGVTSRIAPEFAAVELVADAGPWRKPCCVRPPTDAVPAVHGAPRTVTLTSPVAVTVPPAPTTSTGTVMFAGGPLQALKRHTLVTSFRRGGCRRSDPLHCGASPGRP